MKRIGVLGSGVVGQVLADGFLPHGHEVMRGSREPGKLAAWRAAAGAKASTGSFEEAARFGEIVVLAVRGAAAETVVEALGDALDRKTVIDTTNPISGAPVDGVLPFFTGPNDSLLERLQAKAPGAHFVKAFSCVGSARMVNPEMAGGPPTMFIAGNDADAKTEVKSVLDRFGWDTEDVGVAAAARAIEPLCILWCAPGFLRGSWAHAFKLLR